MDWTAAARAFDAWDHPRLSGLLDAMDPDPDGADPAARDPAARDPAAWQGRLHGRLLRAQWDLREDKPDRALRRLESARSLLKDSRLVGPPTPQALALADAHMALAEAYVHVNLEQVLGVGEVVERAWRAAEAAPDGFLTSRLRLWAALLFGSWCGQARDAWRAVEWFDKAVELGRSGVLLPLGLQAASNAVSLRIEAARKLEQSGSASLHKADEVWQQAARLLDWLLQHDEQVSDYLQASVAINRIELKLHEGQAAQAQAIARTAIERNPSKDLECSLLLALGQALQAQGELAEARDVVQRGMALAQSLNLLAREEGLCEVGAELARIAQDLPQEVQLLRSQRRLRTQMRLAEGRRRAQLSAVVLATERARREAAELRERQLRLELDNQALQRQADVLMQAARCDPLTNLANRRSFDALLAEAHARVRAGSRALCLAYVDIDHFKRVNDRFGHAVGDAVLKRLATLLGAGVRPGDHVARLGGEEFALILMRTGWAQALEVCERLRERVAGHDWQALAPTAVVSISLGLVDAAEFETPALACAEADRRLYAAKRAGRNRVWACAPAQDAA